MSTAPCAMVVTDLDGTLLDSDGRLSARSRASLEAAGRADVLRVVATGRSLYSALRALPTDAPIDDLIFASGAGVLQWRTRRLVHACDLPRHDALRAARVLRELGFDFMLHEAVPENHRFWYYRAAAGNRDFEHRLGRYREHATPWPEPAPDARRFSQLLAVQRPGPSARDRELSLALAPLKVIRTTSPLDHASFWLEVFGPGVSKASGAQWLLDRYRLDDCPVLAVGNDFNDLDLLDWASEARVVGNAPEDLRSRYRNVPTNDDEGFSIALASWLDALG